MCNTATTGFEVLRPGGQVETVPEAAPYKEKVEELERRAREELGPLGALVEEKGITASIHYRNVSPEVGERCRDFVKSEGERLGLRITVGRGVVEARPPSTPIRVPPSAKSSRSTSPKRPSSSATTPLTLTPSGNLRSYARKDVLVETLRIEVKSEEGPPEIIAQADLVVGVENVGEVLRALLDEKG